MWVFAAGMQRSGSTLQYQVAAHLIWQANRGMALGWGEDGQFWRMHQAKGERDEYLLWKTHVCNKDILRVKHECKVLYSYRDLRDVVAGIVRKDGTPFRHLIRRGILQDLIEQYYEWTRFPQVLVASYEKMMRYPVLMVGTMADFLGIEVCVEECMAIAERYSIARQKERIAAGTFVQVGHDWVEERHLLHQNHISNGGKIQGWGDVLSEAEADEIVDRAEDWMRDRGYV